MGARNVLRAPRNREFACSIPSTLELRCIALLWVIVAATLSACSTPRLAAVPSDATTRAAIPGIPEARLWPDLEPDAYVRIALRKIERERTALGEVNVSLDRLPAIDLLAISGGGDAGAFAAGVMCGWTARGDRPQFNVVTGISVGALIAPFAFLGPAYDDAIRRVATESGPADFLRARTTLGGLLSDGLTTSEPLARLVERYVTPEVLGAIAEKYREGRVLLIGTTDLDAGTRVVWDMGAIATSNAPNALELFRKVMIASTSIPGVVSPVMIDVQVDGVPHQEMHVDGGVITQLFLYPGFVGPTLRQQLGVRAPRPMRGWVIRNGRLAPEWTSTQRRTLDIGSRAIRAMVQTQGINDLRRIAALVDEDGLDLRLAYIGAEFQAPHPSEFDTAYMKALFDYGFRLGRSGEAWHTGLPGPD